MTKSPLKYFISISTLLILLSCLSVPAFSQQNEFKGVTKHKTSVYFGAGNRTIETLIKGANVAIIDADSNYLTIKYKDGNAFVLRDDIEYNKEEINKIVDLKEKSKPVAKTIPDPATEPLVDANGYDPINMAGKYISRSGSYRLAAMTIGTATTTLILANVIQGDQIKTVALAGGVVSFLLIFAAEVNLTLAGKELQKKRFSLAPTNNGIGMVYKF